MSNIASSQVGFEAAGAAGRHGALGKGHGALASLWHEQVESYSSFHRSSWYLFHPFYNGLKGPSSSDLLKSYISVR